METNEDGWAEKDVWAKIDYIRAKLIENEKILNEIKMQMDRRDKRNFKRDQEFNRLYPQWAEEE